MRYLYTLLLSLLFYTAFTQQQYNLVPNWSFETYTICPNNLLLPPSYWFSPSNYGTSYFNTCSTSPYFGVPYNASGDNYQYARTGNAYIGNFFLNGPGSNQRNYLCTKLIDSLKKNKYYYTEFFVVSFNDEQLFCNNISMLISKTAQYVDTFHYPNGVLFANAQIYNYGNPIICDTQNWVKVSSIYKAKGGEQYITLGNFKNDSQTNYIAFQPTGYNGAAYCIDDISVIPLDSFNLKANAGRDTTIHIGDSAFIGTLTNGIDSIKWQILNTNGTIDSIRPGFWVHPLINTCYVLTQTVNGYTSSDTVCVNVQTVPVVLSSFSAEKSNESAILKWTTSTEINSKNFEIQRSIDGKIFTTIGVVESKGNSTQISNYSFIDFSPYTGTNYYRLKQVDINGKFSLSEMRIVKFSNSNVVDINIYPNPAHSVTTIQIDKLVGVGTIILTDLYGKQLKIQSLNNINNTLDVSDLTKGIYLINVVVDKGKVTKKLIVE